MIFLGKFNRIFCAILDMEENARVSSVAGRATNGQSNRA